MTNEYALLIQELEDTALPYALRLVWDVFLEFEAPDYVPEGIQEFKNFIQLPSIREQQQKNHFRLWGAFNCTEIVGVIATRNNNHICLLFVKKEYHRRGIARKLFETVKAECVQQESKAEKMTVNSSPFAVEVYHRLGFVDLDSEQVVNGIRFTPMVFTLPL